jgi:hypothetical protein
MKDHQRLTGNYRFSKIHHNFSIDEESEDNKTNPLSSDQSFQNDEDQLQNQKLKVAKKPTQHFMKSETFNQSQRETSK